MLEKIKKARRKNEDIVRIVEEMKRARVKELRGNEWKIEGELVLKEGKVYVPKDEKLSYIMMYQQQDMEEGRRQ